MITRAENGFLRSLEDVEREFDQKGISKADWAREHGFSRASFMKFSPAVLPASAAKPTAQPYCWA
mgnify:CR=1 FL=1